MLGDSLNAWCKREGLQRQNVTSALTGAWDGPKARAIRERVIAYLGARGVIV